jgi:hypothetical protein
VNLPKLLSFESGRIVFFETLTKHPENWQQNPTPLCIVRKMLDKTSLEEKKILVLFNIEFLQVLVEERKINPENIYYIADNELEYLSAIKIFKVQSYKLSDISVPALKKLIVGLDMKFDLVFSNPPYNDGTDISILSQNLSCFEEFIVIHPSSWLLDIKSSRKPSFKTSVDKKIKSLELFNANKIFNGIHLEVPITITHYDSKYNGTTKISISDVDNHHSLIHSKLNSFEVSSLFDMTKFCAEWNFVKPFYERVLKYCENENNLWDKRVINFTDLDNSKMHCQLTPMMNGFSKGQPKMAEKMYSFVMKDESKNYGIRNKSIWDKSNPNKILYPTYEFQSNTEIANLISYCKTDFARFCLALFKNSANMHRGEMTIVPWLDFTEEWDDEKLFKKFDVSQELQDYIRDFLPDFHGIRK